jgi:hypothetical protein
MFVSTEAATYSNALQATGAFTLQPTWDGPATTTGTLYGLQYQYDVTTGLPTTYKGFGTKTAVALSNGGSFTNQNVAMATVTSATLSGTVTAQTGYTITSRGLSMTMGLGVLPLLNDISTPATPTSASFSYLTPVVTGATFRLNAYATKAPVVVQGYKLGLASNATGATLALPAGSEYSLPVDAATGVTDTLNFSWTQMPNAVYVIQFNGATGQPRYQVVTSATTTKIPNLASLGLTLPSAAAYTWSIVGISPLGSVDAAASSAGILGVLNTASGAADVFVGQTGIAAPRKFTTAP